MPSKISKFDFSNCQHLRKILIAEKVEFTGQIDLTDTPIKSKNSLTSEKFNELAEGVTATENSLNRVNLKAGTIEGTIPEISS